MPSGIVAPLISRARASTARREHGYLKRYSKSAYANGLICARPLVLHRKEHGLHHIDAARVACATGSRHPLGGCGPRSFLLRRVSEDHRLPLVTELEPGALFHFADRSLR